MNTMKFNGVITRKLAVIAREVDKLRGLPPLTVRMLRADHFLKRGIERALQVCVEAMIDTANRLVALRNHPPATTAVESLQILDDAGVIESAASYAAMVKFRNFIVHRYEAIDDAVLVRIVRRHLGDFDRFVAEIGRHAAA